VSEGRLLSQSIFPRMSSKSTTETLTRSTTMKNESPCQLLWQRQRTGAIHAHGNTIPTNAHWRCLPLCSVSEPNSASGLVQATPKPTFYSLLPSSHHLNSHTSNLFSRYHCLSSNHPRWIVFVVLSSPPARNLLFLQVPPLFPI
jgi:hypothetical protein